jgi:fibronectin-binding autotransporter adhesin
MASRHAFFDVGKPKMYTKIHRACCVVSIVALVAIVGLGFVPESARAATEIWTGASSTLWNNLNNWNPTVVPANGDSLVFSSAGAGNLSNNISGLTVAGISFDPTAGAFTLSTNSLHVGTQTTGTGINHTGDIINSSSTAETISLGLTFDAGRHVIGTSSGALNLSGPITSSLGSAVLFSPGAGNINVVGSGLTTSNGILGGWATIGPNWATLDGSNNVVAYNGYTNVSGGGTIASNAASNVRIPTAGTAISVGAGTTNINSLLFSGSLAVQTINVGTGNTLTLGQNGGIFNTTGYYAGGFTVRNLTIGANAATGGTLTAGDGVNPATITLQIAPVGSASGGLSINSAIKDNGSAPVSLVLNGGYMTPGGVNTYSGGTYILSGRISQPIGTSFGSGPIYIFPGGMINPGATSAVGGVVNIANAMFLAGNGTTEGNGLGAVRMFQNTNGATTELSGVVTLMADASICSNSLTSTQIAANRHVAVINKVTGPGGLGIGSPTTTSNNGMGVVEIGALTGAAVANDYAGDTTINGGGSNGSALRISASGDNNIMPHGLTGSYAGGPTGNVVLNGGVGPATLDLNGSTQTINGLRNATANNNFVQSSTAGGLLILGDSNATATFGGVVQDGAGNLAIRKIGTGVQTFSGTNSYSSATDINDGALSITGSLSTSGAVNVNTSATTSGALYGGTSTSSSAVGNVTLAAVNNSHKAVINPGPAGPGSVGTLAPASLTVNTGADLQFDAFGASAGSFDQLAVSGTVTFSGAATISPSITVAGTGYTLLTSTGISGTAPTLGAGDTRLTYSFNAASYPTVPTATSIIVDALGSVANSSWTGSGDGTTWNLHSTANFSSTAGTNPNLFYNGDNVTFGNTANTNIAVVGTVAPGSTLFNNTSGNYVIGGSGSIGGPGSLTRNGAGGTTTLATSNTYSGGTVLTAGTLNVNNAGALGLPNSTVTGLTINGGSLGNTSGKLITASSNPTQSWAADFSFNGPNDLNLGTGAVGQTGLANGANRTITVTAGTLTVGGTIADGSNGLNGLIKAGSGTLALSGANTFTGPVTINAGTLRVSSFSSLGTSTAGHTIAAGGTLDLGGFTTPNVAAGGFASAPFTISGTGVNGKGAIVNTGPFGQTNAFQSITLAANASVGGDGGPAPIFYAAGSITAPTNSYNGRFDIRSGAALLNLNGNTLTKTGTNEVGLVGISVNNGSIIVDQGVLSLEGATAIIDNNDGTSITVNTNAILQFVNPTTSIARPIVLKGAIVNDASAGGGGGTVNSNVQLQGNPTFNGPNTSTLTLPGLISQSGGARSITKTGPSTLALQSTANSYSGGTNLNGGVVSFIAASGAFSVGTGPLNFDGGTLLYGSGFTDDVSILPITLNAGGGTIDSNGNIITLAHNIVGSGGLAVRSNNQMVTLSGTNTYAGVTNVQNGTLIVGSAGAIPATTTLVLGSSTNESGTFDLNGRNVTVAGLATIGNGAQTIGNSSTSLGGTLTFAGGAAASTYSGAIVDTVNGGNQQTALAVNSGTLTLSGSNSYSAGTTVNGGTLILGNGSALGSSTGTLTVNTGGTVRLGGNSPTIGALNGNGGTITNPGFSSTLTVGNGDTSGSSASALTDGASGSLILVKTGIGTQTLSGNSSFSGGTTVSAGTLVVGHVNALGTGALNVDNTSIARLQSGLTAPVQLPSLTIAGGTTPTAKLDMTDNNMVVHNGSISTTFAQLRTGLNSSGTLWTGNGIQSTTAAADAAAHTNSTVFAVGAILNIDKNNNLIYSTWPAPLSPDSGATGLATTDVLVKFTYFGDADLNGVVDNTTDYDLWSNGFTNPTLAATNGWLYGDFDFSGIVDNTTDYDLWSTGFAHQGGPLSGGPASATPTTVVQPVPEPAALVLAAIGFSHLLLRRRSRR